MLSALGRLASSSLSQSTGLPALSSALPALSRLVSTSGEALSAAAAPATKKVAAGRQVYLCVGTPVSVVHIHFLIAPAPPNRQRPPHTPHTGSSGKPPLYKEFQLYRCVRSWTVHAQLPRDATCGEEHCFYPCPVPSAVGGAQTLRSPQSMLPTRWTLITVGP